jgi:Fic family protein
VRDAGHFNHRQRELLAQALRRPNAEFTLRKHRMDYQTAYSTARADLLELAEMGYLEKQSRGQAFIFTPTPDLRERLAREQSDEA